MENTRRKTTMQNSRMLKIMEKMPAKIKVPLIYDSLFLQGIQSTSQISSSLIFTVL